jgi:hypothetical protein
MQCPKIQNVCVFGTLLEKSSVNLVFIPVFKPHAHKLYILRHCTYFVQLTIRTDHELDNLHVKSLNETIMVK